MYVGYVIACNGMQWCTYVMYACMYVFMYVCIYVCMYLCMHACMHVCMYVYTLYIYISLQVTCGHSTSIRHSQQRPDSHKPRCVQLYNCNCLALSWSLMSICLEILKARPEELDRKPEEFT